MNHAEIEAEQLLDLYLMGRLDPERQDQLEQHFIGCAECTNELEMRSAFIRGIKQLDATEFVGHAAFRSWRGLALAASVLLAITGPLSIWSTHQLSTIERAGLYTVPMDVSFFVMPLVSTRGVDAEAPNVVELTAGPQWFIFEPEGDYLPGAKYSVRLMSAATEPVFQQQVVADNRGVLTLGLPASLLQTGNYRLYIGGPEPRGAERHFQLQVIPQGDTMP